ncbi:MAG TPA: methyltransferase [Polyangiaceae bacterium]|jgi:tRNA1(Val) A37 N6-methylase TrmN6|nr:methyltransferase [Polyangiaceae bacterium]
MSAAGKTSLDALYDGAISLRQPARGYRVNVDAILLAAFAAEGKKAQFALDLGAGVGAVALCLRHLGAATAFGLLERDPVLLEFARENAERANLRADFFCRDLADGLPEGLGRRADLVVSNPPFFAPESGRTSAESPKTPARFGKIEPFLDAAASAISGTRARVAFVYPARELSSFLHHAERVRLIAKRVRFVHADSTTPARVVLIEMQRAKPGGLVVLPPLFEWLEKGVRSPEIARLLRGATSAESSTNDRR